MRNKITQPDSIIQDTIKRPDIIFAAIAVACIGANILAFIFQFFYNSLPCPLCLLQRWGITAMGLGATLSILDRPSWKYDLIITLSSLFTFVVAIRQILKHIVPPDPGFGSTFLGFHFYIWSALISLSLLMVVAMITPITIMLDKFNIPQFTPKFIITIIGYTFTVITLINLVAMFFECGFTVCPSEPTKYLEWEGKIT